MTSSHVTHATALISMATALLGFLAGRAWPAPDATDAGGGAAAPTSFRRLEQLAPGTCKLDRSCAFSIDEDTMEASVQVARLPIVPEAFRERIIIELGANTVYTVRDTLLKQPKFRGHFVVSFEPLLDKYASNLAGRSKAVMRATLGHHHRRGVILPFAVGPTQGVFDLQVSDIDGCSSLLNFTAPPQGKKSARPGCSVARERRRVPGVTLRTVMGWLPAGSEVDFLKSDIQGMDLLALKSAGDQLPRIRRVQMEAALGHHYNDGSPDCTTVMAEMTTLGFRLASPVEIDGFAPLEGAFGTPLVYAGSPTTCASTDKQEVDIFFIRRDPKPEPVTAPTKKNKD
tara:strand:- start:369 stop:1397 length:1029 start_codon:yes stop_codon:yes gene_type:complete